MPSAALTRPALAAAGASHTGLQRENNEDRFHCDAARGFFMVIDGVGGHAAGEKAAETALTMIRARLERETGQPADRVREAIALANNEIVRAGASEPAWHGMACVLTVALVRDGRLTIGHVGDTRLYAFTASGFSKVTHDHSPIGEREDQGEIDETEAMHHPRRNEIYRDVGSEPHEPGDEEFVELIDQPFDADSALLLCSDGLSDMVPSARLARILLEHAGDPRRAAERLIEAANQAGGKDNVTAVVVEGAGFADAAQRRLRADIPDGGPTGRPRIVGAARRVRKALVSRPAMLGYGLAAGLATAAALLFLAAGVTDSVLQLVRPGGWSRTWQVGQDADAEFATIGDALERARPGDVVEVGPGGYELPSVLPSGINLVSRRPREAVLHAPPADVARVPGIRVMGGSRLAGFKIDAPGGVMASVGAEGGDEAVLENLEIVGASRSAVVFGERSRGVLRGSYVHDNPEVAVLVTRQALPTLVQNVITANGKPSAGAARMPDAAGHVRPAVVLEEGASAVFFGNVIAGNADDQVWGLAAEKKADVLRDNVIGLPAPPRNAAPVRPPAAGAPRRK